MGGNIENNAWEENSEELLFQEEQKSIDNAMRFLDEPEAIPIVEKYQEIINEENKATVDYIGKNIAKTRKKRELSKFLGKNFNETVYVKGKKEGFKLNSIYIDTFNDNGIAIDGEFFGDDTGKTFGFNAEVDFNIGEDKYKVKGSFNHYTAGERFVYDNDGVRDWDATDFTNSSRIDQIDIGVKKEILNYNNIKGDNYSVNLGVGGQVIGNFSGEKIQKDWHNFRGYYEHKAKYKAVSGATIDVRGDVSGKKYILGDQDIGTYISGKSDFKLAGNSKYGESTIGGKVGFGIDMGGFNTELGHSKKILNGPTGSSTIQESMQDNNIQSGNYIKISAPVPFIDDLNLEYKYEDNTDGNDYMTVGVNYDF